MNKIKRIGIVSRVWADKHQELFEYVMNTLQNYDVEIFANEFFAEKQNYKQPISLEDLSTLDLIIALGGDGTILWTARHSGEVPIFGINAGYLGFLTTATLADCAVGINRIMKNDYILERCMRLKVSLDGMILPTALNEVYVTNAKNAKICTIDISVNGHNLGSHRLDGLLVSTPVGSTAYAMSAGGSIIDPRIKAMQIVPVNSVERRIRPFVVPGESKIAVTIPQYFDKKIVIVIDGMDEIEMSHNSILDITKAEKETVFLRFPDYGFFQRLQDKLGF